MDLSPVDQIFELALDLPEKEREKMLAKLAVDEPETAAEVRRLLANPNCRVDFAATSRSRQPVSHLHHVAVQVEDIGKAAEWYRSVLGCEIEYQDQTWAMLALANMRLALVIPEQHPPHFCVTRDDATKFGELTTHRDGTKSVYIKDPWGNSIEVLDRESLPADQKRGS
ncbi:MAG: VOC family protein [bacterium]|nr:VOC family protein [bacterium]